MDQQIEDPQASDVRPRRCRLAPRSDDAVVGRQLAPKINQTLPRWHLTPAWRSSPSHTHPKSAFIYAYVLSAEVISAVDDEKPPVYRAGESWHEALGAHHPVTRNPSKTTPAKLLVIFVAHPDERQLVFPDSK
jgi:hypothetical protein